MTTAAERWARDALTPLLCLSVLAGGCIREPEATMCASGIYCPAGAKCAPHQAICLYDDCGDGVVQAGEVCDDGDVLSGRVNALGEVISSGTCNAECTSDETCGNRYIDEAMGEACDDGNHESGDGCAADCLSRETCGNGTVDPGEECDTITPTSYCNCLECSASRHGDGIVNPLHGEECDGGAPDDVDASDDCRSADCNANCTVSEHGDGVVNPLHDGEECDDGRADVATDGCGSARCDPDCSWTVCGDGVVNPLSEACDDGNDDEEDDCLSTCRWNVCGDGLVDLQGPVTEGCDLGPLNGRTECGYGLTSCAGCDTGCVPIPFMQTDYCGDGTDDGTMEECDSASSFACGTCEGSTCAIVGVKDAKGEIRISSADVEDGDFLILADGLGRTTTFELDRDGTCADAEALCVAVAATATAVEIAQAIDGRLDTLYAASELAIQSTRSTAVLTLTNTEAGIAGNVQLELGSASGVDPTAITVEGMSGGVGCPPGDACFATRDCARGSYCWDGYCVQW